MKIIDNVFEKNDEGGLFPLTRALETGGGGRFCPPLMFFVNIFRSIRSIAVIFFNTWPKINGEPFGAK